MATSFRRGVRLAVDVGSVRIGLAKCDPDGLLSTPLATVVREKPNADRADDLGKDVQTVLSWIREVAAMEIIVGLPRHLSGVEGDSAYQARSFAMSLAEAADIPVRLVDERLSTVVAHQQLRDSGRKERKHRKVIDQVAAMLILESAIESEKSTGKPAGEAVVVPVAGTERDNEKGGSHG